MKSVAIRIGWAARWMALVGFLLLGPSLLRAAEFSRDLPGDWDLIENYRAVDDPANADRFIISRVVMDKSKWADGQFDLQFDGDSSPIRGYFSFETGRVWIKTQRRVDGRTVQVEYIGTLREDGTIRWTGLANTAGRKMSWGFEAVRRSNAN